MEGGNDGDNRNINGFVTILYKVVSPILKAGTAKRDIVKNILYNLKENGHYTAAVLRDLKVLNGLDDLSVLNTLNQYPFNAEIHIDNTVIPFKFYHNLGLRMDLVSPYKFATVAEEHIKDFKDIYYKLKDVTVVSVLRGFFLKLGLPANCLYPLNANAILSILNGIKNKKEKKKLPVHKKPRIRQRTRSRRKLSKYLRIEIEEKIIDTRRGNEDHDRLMKLCINIESLLGKSPYKNPNTALVVYQRIASICKSNTKVFVSNAGKSIEITEVAKPDSFIYGTQVPWFMENYKSEDAQERVKRYYYPTVNNLEQIVNALMAGANTINSYRTSLISHKNLYSQYEATLLKDMTERGSELEKEYFDTVDKRSTLFEIIDYMDLSSEWADNNSDYFKELGENEARLVAEITSLKEEIDAVKGKIYNLRQAEKDIEDNLSTATKLYNVAMKELIEQLTILNLKPKNRYVTGRYSQTLR